MPKVSDSTELIRITQTMKAMVFFLNGDKKEAACAKAGISLDIFNQWVSEAKDVVERYQSDFMRVQQTRLVLVASAEARLLDRLISQSEEERDPMVLIKVLEYLGRQRKELESKLGAVVSHTSADEYLDDMIALSGPKMVVEQSKMLEKKKDPLRFNIAPRPDGSVDVTVPRKVDILDLNPDEFQDIEPEQRTTE